MEVCECDAVVFPCKGRTDKCCEASVATSSSRRMDDDILNEEFGRVPDPSGRAEVERDLRNKV